MAILYALTTARSDDPKRPYARRSYEWFMRAVELDQVRQHDIGDDPGTADIILFVGAHEAGQRDVRVHPFTREYREKCFIYDPGDRPIAFLPGVYTGIEQRWYDRSRIRSGFYLRQLGFQSITPCWIRMFSGIYILLWALRTLRR